MLAKKGKRHYPKPMTNLTLVAAYAFQSYSVVIIEANGWYGQKVYCHYYDINWNKLDSPVESMVFPEFAVHCCRHPRAFYMAISKNKDEKLSLRVPVIDRTVDMCLAPLYGNESKWLLFAELIEHYKLQGVQHFYIYVKDIDDYSRLLIDDYEKSGEIEVIYFKKEQDRPAMDWQIVGVMDCLQRSRHHSRYAIFTDLDERIMALGNQTLVDYIM
ncbi:unnamed protein product [Cylicostephanus goldi]|uniref:Glycosyltransferase family 92 protein n=1 Tax=Cylicostephanus goldi TaxID=71465 RepID=A0A3P7MT11_CYLGO|nr:unnamed protein product [Cylicostephanus goldi]